MTLRALRLTTLIAAAAVILPLGAVVSPATSAPSAALSSTTTEPVQPDTQAPVMIEVEPEDFVDEAAALPSGLVEAIERDTELTAAEYLANAAAGDAAVTVVDALAEQLDVLGSEMQGSELVVYVADAADAAVVEQSGATAVIGEQTFPDTSDVVLNPAFDLRGGEHHYYDGFRCTTGFVGANAASATQLITAGHCGTGASVTRNQYRTQSAPFDYSAGNPLLGGVTPLGPPVASSYQDGFGYDHGLISIATPANWQPLPQITTWNFGGGSNTQSPLTIRDARSPIVNETACKSGATSGWTCGPIVRVNELTCVGGEADNPATPNINEERRCEEGVAGDYTVNGTWANICIRGGDSGGPVVVGATAIGINSASSALSGVNERCTPDDVGVFAPLYTSGAATANNPYGNRSADSLYPSQAWQVSVGVSTPTLTNTALGANRFETTTLSGTVPSGSSRHGVTVTIDGSQTFTPTVSSSGAWSVNVGTLSPGVHQYAVQATWRGRSPSAVRSGAWLNSPIQRFDGPDRYAAAADISRRSFFPEADNVQPGVDRVFVATGDNFPDALAAGPVAASFGSPLLLTPRSNTLPASVAAELDRLNPRQIVVIGGTSSMPPALVTAMATYASDPLAPTVRVNGQTRYDVSLALLEFAGFSNVARAWVVTGNGFADALSVSAVAADELVPVILVPGTDADLDEAFLAQIRAIEPARISVGGGPNSVSNGIVSQLNTVAPTTRFGGADRFVASVNINNEVHPTATTAYLANGLNYPDALAGGVVAGLEGAPLFIGYPSCVPTAAVDRMLQLGITLLKVLGGTASQSVAAENLVRC